MEKERKSRTGREMRRRERESDVSILDALLNFASLLIHIKTLFTDIHSNTAKHTQPHTHTQTQTETSQLSLTHKLRQANKHTYRHTLTQLERLANTHTHTQTDTHTV